MDIANLSRWRHYQAKIIPYLLLLVLSFVSCQGFIAHQPTSTATSSQTVSTSPLFTIRPALFSVNNVVWSPDGKRIAIANADGLAQVWNAATGQLISTHDYEHAIGPAILGWSTDSQRLISTTFPYAGPVVIWNASTGKALVTLPTQSAPLAASHDGKHIATMAGHTIQVWDTFTGHQMFTIDVGTDIIDYLVWSPDDRRFATTHFHYDTEKIDAQVWDASTGKHICTYNSPSNNQIHALAWSPDGQRIVSAVAGSSDIEQVWDATTGNLLLSYNDLPQLEFDQNNLVWSPDGIHVASWQASAYSSLTHLFVWDATTGKSTFIAGTQNDTVTSAAWSPDGKQIAVASNNSLYVLNTATGKPVVTYHKAINTRNVTWSPDGKYLASVNDKEVILWEATADRYIASIPARHQVEYTVSWSPDGTQITAEDGATSDEGFWKTITGEHIGDTSSYHENIGRLYSSHISALAWSPDGMNVASSGYVDDPSPLPRESGVSILPSNPIVCQGPPCISGGSHTGLITALSWSPDSKSIASASLDKTVVVYDIANQKDLVIYHDHTGGVTAVAWSPDGKRIASASADRTIQVWDATNGVQSFTLHGHTAAVTSVAWSPDGKRIASASQDGSVRIWDMLHHTLLLTYHSHSGAVEAVAWSPDGKRIASASADTTVQVWNATTGNTILTYRGHSDIVYSAVWSPDGTRIASASKDGTIQLWCALSSRCQKMP